MVLVKTDVLPLALTSMNDEAVKLKQIHIPIVKRLRNGFYIVEKHQNSVQIKYSLEKESSRMTQEEIELAEKTLGIKIFA